MGASEFASRNGHWPTFRDVYETIWLGALATNWADFDPLWEFGFPQGSFAGYRHQDYG
jgi:hypothetical protein